MKVIKVVLGTVITPINLKGNCFTIEVESNIHNMVKRLNIYTIVQAKKNILPIVYLLNHFLIL